jgi:hypothetical protein
MANKWLAHVKKTMKSHKGMKFGQVLKMAKKTYKGGAGSESVQPFSSDDATFSGPSAASPPNGTIRDVSPVGGRRRRSRKTRRGSRRA